MQGLPTHKRHFENRKLSPINQYFVDKLWISNVVTISKLVITFRYTIQIQFFLELKNWRRFGYIAMTDQDRGILIEDFFLLE